MLIKSGYCLLEWLFFWGLIMRDVWWLGIFLEDLYGLEIDLKI